MLNDTNENKWHSCFVEKDRTSILLKLKTVLLKNKSMLKIIWKNK